MRLVVSPRTLRQASAEVKRRRDAQAELVPLESVEARVRSLLESS